MRRIVAGNGVTFYRSELIPCPHGFSTRLGGVSKLPHTASLNLGVDRGDEKETVLENLRLFADAVGVPMQEIISVSQIHSDKVRTVTKENCGEGFFKAETELCDGYIAQSKGVVLGIRTADCVPVLIYAPPHKDFDGAVMALHAGWRGTALGIVTKAVEKAKALGADPKEMRAAIGPSIGKCCYEVREDFYNKFLEMAGRELTEKYVHPKSGESGVYFADLKSVNRELLLRAGLPSENIDVSALCTCCCPDEFFSHRFSGGLRGTMLSIIAK